MQRGNFIITGDNCFDAINGLVKKDFEIGYEKALPDSNQYYIEDYSMLNNSNLLMAVTVEKVNAAENQCKVEIIAGGGGGGLFALTWGNEERRVTKFYKRMKEFCDSAGYEISNIEKHE